MGLHVQTLETIPASEERDYVIYLLDYGWPEPLGKALNSYYEKMTKIAEQSNAVVIRSDNRVHFEDEVFSWHHINGKEAKDLLPGILITNRNPHRFKEAYFSNPNEPIENDLKLVLIPLRKFCTTPTDVAVLIDRLFNDIREGKDLSDFQIGEEIKKGGEALADALILEPSTSGMELTWEDIKSFILNSATEVSGSVGRTVYPIHFEDFGGKEFERLVFAYVSRRKDWTSISWLGETGSEGGRDVWGVFNSETYCYQCANYKSFRFSKISKDIDKLVNGGTIPHHFIAVCSSAVSSEMRDRVVAYAKGVGIETSIVWSGSEFEEMLRKNTPELIRRFFEGEIFPDDAASLIKMAKGVYNGNDEDILSVLGDCFDRPAFTTPFRNEASIPDFAKAIDDTIEVLNTGVHRLRDGTEIRRIPSRHMVKNVELKKKLAEITNLVVQLRDEFTRLKADKEIRPCGCNDKNCSVWFLSDFACQKMDKLRQQILKKYRGIYPAFEPHLAV